MTLPDRLNSRAESDLLLKTSSASDADSSVPPPTGLANAPDTFDEWLDTRIKVLYQAVLNEPLPSDIAELLNKSQKPK